MSANVKIPEKSSIPKHRFLPYKQRNPISGQHPVTGRQTTSRAYDAASHREQNPNKKKDKIMINKQENLKMEAVTTAHPRYPFIEDLLNLAFPRQERRDDARQRHVTDHNPLFTPYLIYANGQEIGLLTLWRFPGFTFAEHLAISPGIRNGGYGGRVVEWLKQNEKNGIILEAELPETDLSRRRVAFYERYGFKICPKPYFQPPYHAGEAPLPLLLMYYGWDSLDGKFEEIRDTLHANVYGTVSK